MIFRAGFALNIVGSFVNGFSGKMRTRPRDPTHRCFGILLPLW